MHGLAFTVNVNGFSGRGIFVFQVFWFGKNCSLSLLRHVPFPARTMDEPVPLQAGEAAVYVALRDAGRPRPVGLGCVGVGDHCLQELGVGGRRCGARRRLVILRQIAQRRQRSAPSGAE